MKIWCWAGVGLVLSWRYVQPLWLGGDFLLESMLFTRKLPLVYFTSIRIITLGLQV